MVRAKQQQTRSLGRKPKNLKASSSPITTAFTYKSMCTKRPKDDHVWQTRVPEMSLQYDFLLNGIFALSAFEAASVSERDRARYASAATGYQTMALSSLRPLLDDITPQSFEAMLCFSLILMALTLASPQFMSESAHGDGENMIQHTLTHFELLRGCEVVLGCLENHITESPYTRRNEHWEDLPRVSLDSRTKAAIDQLSAANERRTRNDPYGEACKKAISLLQECFEKCVNDDYQSYAPGWLNIAGKTTFKPSKWRTMWRS
ncbi:uncharacterized protein Z518_04090 [Rhinocladiella mackenziei CBS 650.93]|uniref:C6 transcription factor n=1 Tax=Rhinocladiella mackenziei CBS 650.93 TaxID=1442369 RepID=A0A0D2ISJ6_9EURO|nr:uncharacterized protein Z518_04090 [Rhinocladiella mackenziei CBS 650.93]KIX06116.1 hypothetical protein Z518_04090 [Rhinocladiella mackenziei CBS 650.93]